MVSSRACPSCSTESYFACQELVGPLGPSPFCQRFRAMDCDGKQLSRTAYSPTPWDRPCSLTASFNSLWRRLRCKTQNLSRWSPAEPRMLVFRFGKVQRYNTFLWTWSSPLASALAHAASLQRLSASTNCFGMAVSALSRGRRHAGLLMMILSSARNLPLRTGQRRRRCYAMVSQHDPDFSDST
jgi:hypothetical protein